MIIPSMWTSYLNELSPLEMAKTMAAHGWQACELSDEHSHDLLKLGEPAAVGENFKKQCSDMGIQFPQGHFLLCTKGCRPEDMEGRKLADIAPEDDSDFNTAMDAMKRWVDLFAAVGIKAGVLHSGGEQMLKNGAPFEKVFQRRCQAISTITDYARNTGVNICLENLTSKGTVTCQELLQILNAVNATNLAICLDTGHANINKLNAADFALEAGKHLKALHIADNLGTRDDHMLPWGRGTVQWTEFMAALHKIDYNGLFNFEVPGENKCPMPVRLAKLDYARKLADLMLNS